MVKLHTSQLNFGKVVKGKQGIGFLDTTVRTGNDFVKEYIAPTWEMVKAAHAGELDWYCDVYLKRLIANRDIILKALEGWANKASLTDMVLGCYDAENKFCHRHLLKRFLLDNSKVFEKGGEVSKNTIFTGDISNRAVILVAGDVDCRKSVRDIVGVDVGSHMTTALDTSAIDTSLLRLEKIAELHKQSEELAAVGTMPLIDFSELGNVLKDESEGIVSGGMITCQGPRVGNDTPWYIVFGEGKDVHGDIRKLMFIPAFELCPVDCNAEFESKMDDYYCRSIINAKSSDD